MESTEERLALIAQKIQRLVKELQYLKKEREQLGQQAEQLKASNQSLASELDDVRQQNLILKASLDAMDPNEKKELERKLNAYIKNIDKCVELLSH